MTIEDFGFHNSPCLGPPMNGMSLNLIVFLRLCFSFTVKDSAILAKSASDNQSGCRSSNGSKPFGDRRFLFLSPAPAGLKRIQRLHRSLLSRTLAVLKVFWLTNDYSFD